MCGNCIVDIHLELRDLSKSFGSVTAVSGVSLDIGHGEFVSLLGPSGCGKTTILNMVAGFLQPDAGDLNLSGRRINGIPPHKRPTAIVFQSYALFPHLTIEGNVEFGLKMRGMARDQRKAKVQQVLELVQLPDVQDRYPRQLSGGQQQRIALARALVIEPDILLLDEPLSNLDARLRDEMRLELKELQDKIKITTLFVTHDILEAFALSDRVAVMSEGRIVQVGTAAELYENPASESVANFLGPLNTFDASVVEVAGGEVTARVAAGQDIVATYRSASNPTVGEPHRFMVRPENVRVSQSERTGANCFSGKVQRKIYLGPIVHLLVDTGQMIVLAYVQQSEARMVDQGDPVVVHWRADDVITSE